MREALRSVEAASGKNFGDSKNPLLISCRSGAKFSMPGMMDTVLNIGLNDQTVQEMIALTGDERFVFDAHRRLIQMFGNVVTGIPDEVFERKISETRKKAGVKTDSQLTEVFKSWNGKRAIDYRNAAGISHDLGTAVNIMTMVFGNMGDDSATGVTMTRNSSTGENCIEGDYLTNAQGEDVVAGIRDMYRTIAGIHVF